MNNMLTMFIKTLDFGMEKMQIKIDRESIISMMYTLETLSCRGLTVRGTVHKNLNWLKKWYGQEDSQEYLEMALLQICALFGMGLIKKDDITLYREICSLADTSVEELLENCISMSKPVKVSRQGIYSLIGKWMPGKNNPMKKSEVVEDIMDKLMNHREGQYFYCYERHRGGDKYMGAENKDMYKLVISQEESYFFDLKQFRIYIFEL